MPPVPFLFRAIPNTYTDETIGQKQVKWLSPEEINAPTSPEKAIVVIDEEAAWSIKENQFTPLVERIRGLLIHLQEEKSASHDVATWLEDHLYENEIGSSTYTGAFSDAGGLDALLYLALSPKEADDSIQTVAWRSIGEAIQVMPFFWSNVLDLMADRCPLEQYADTG